MGKMFKKLTKRFSLLLIVSLVTACGRTNSTSYKIDVNLSVDGKLIQASGVQKLSCFQTAEWAAGMGSGSCRLKGEAIPIDLGQRGYIFMLMEIPQYYIDKINSPISSTIVNDENGKRYKWDIEPSKMPMFVRFADIKDPKTVQQVHFFDYEVIDYYKEYKSAPDVAPEHRAIMKSMPADASAILGGSVSLISVHVEHTKDWPNFGRIEKVLPWLHAIGYYNLDGSLGQPLNPNLSETLTKNNFYWR